MTITNSAPFAMLAPSLEYLRLL